MQFSCENEIVPNVIIYCFQGETEYEFVMSEFLRINGIYWGLTAMDLMGGLEKMQKSQVGFFIDGQKMFNKNNLQIRVCIYF